MDILSKNNKMEEYLVEFGKIGTHLGTRFGANKVRQQIEEIFETTDRFIFNFAGVETISESYADECFAKLLYKFDFEDIKRKTNYQAASPFIKAAIANAMKIRLDQENKAKESDLKGT